MIAKLLRNKVFTYMLLRYFAYALQFIGTLIIAYRLGPTEFGLWSYLLLIIQLMAQFNFGIPISVQNSLSIFYNKKANIDFTLSSGIILTFINIILSILSLFVIDIFGWYHWNDQNLHQHIFFLMVIVSLGYYNILLQNIYRVYGKYAQINFHQLILPLLVFFYSIVSSNETLVIGLVWVYALASILSTVNYLVAFPLKFNFKISLKANFMLLRKSLQLFFYNSAFYIILISTRLFASDNFSQTEFGLFSFSFTLVIALTLFLDSLAFLIHPKLLNKFSRMSSEDLPHFFKLKDLYTTVSHLLLHLGIVFFILLTSVYTEYSPSVDSFVILATAYCVLSLGFGFNAILMAKEKNVTIAKISVVSLIINILLSLITIKLELPIIFLGVTITLAFAFFVIGNYINLLKTLNLPFQLSNLITHIFQIRFILPVVAYTFILFLDLSPFYFFCGLPLFAVLNRADIIKSMKMALEIFNNPSLVDIK